MVGQAHLTCAAWETPKTDKDGYFFIGQVGYHSTHLEYLGCKKGEQRDFYLFFFQNKHADYF